MNGSAQTLIHGLTREQIEQICLSLNQPAFRARQIWDWLYARYASNWQEMLNIPEGLKHALENRLSLDSAVPVRFEGNERARTERKILLRLRDGECIEAVLIPAKGRNTLCISSQVGCKFHCAFCASGQAGFRRHLQAGEMVGQVIAASMPGVKSAVKPSHVVFMGIGEPLDNYDQVMAAIRIINDSDGLAIGARRITISTCGIIPGIQHLAREGLQVELSVSLHAPDDVLRSSLMPMNRQYPLNDLLKACGAYAADTGRIITFEYTLIRDVNDSVEQARALAGLLRPVRCRVNLIPLSPVAEFEGRPSPAAMVDRFAGILNRASINTTVRASKGCRLNAACGQLRYALRPPMTPET